MQLATLGQALLCAGKLTITLSPTKEPQRFGVRVELAGTRSFNARRGEGVAADWGEAIQVCDQLVCRMVLNSIEELREGEGMVLDDAIEDFVWAYGMEDVSGIFEALKALLLLPETLENAGSAT